MATSPFSAPLGGPRFRAWNQSGSSPLALGKVYVYLAGTTTAANSYPTYADAIAGTNANANPVILDAYGEAPIYLQNVAYKIVVKDSADVTQWTMDYVSPALGYPYATPSEWVQESTAVAFGSATSFTVTGVDKTSTYHAGRRIKTTNTGGTVYSTVKSSSFATNTTVNVTNDSGTIDSGISAAYYGLTSFASPSYLTPRSFFTCTKSGDMTGFGSSTKVITWTAAEQDALTEWDNANNRWVAKYPGKYLVTVSAEYGDTGTNIAVTLQIAKNNSVVAQSTTRSSATASQVWSVSAHYLLNATAAGDYIEVFALGSANTTIKAGLGTRFTVVAAP
jgi:hypothetical protein